MKRLIRFEDKYGMPDIVCPIQGLGMPDIDNEKLTCNTLKENVFIQFGLSIGAVLDFDDILKAEVYKNNIDEIIYVFDMDPISGRGILTVDEIEEKVKGIVEKIKGMNRTVNIKFAPIVWSAETIMLYAFLDIFESDTKIKCTDVTKLIHLKNTAKFQGRILDEILKHNGYDMTKIKVKHMRKYQPALSDMKDKLNGIIQSYPNSINKNVIKWILSGSIGFLYDCKSVIQHQQDIVTFYNQNKPEVTDTFCCYETEIRLNQKCW